MSCSNWDGLKFAKSKSGRKKKEKIKKAPSILQDKEDKRCFLCMMLKGDRKVKPVEEHHIYFGERLRRISDQNGFTCNLCMEHHRTGRDAVHKNHETALLLQKICQTEFEKTHTRKEFMSLTGENYIGVKAEKP